VQFFLDDGDDDDDGMARRNLTRASGVIEE